MLQTKCLPLIPSSVFILFPFLLLLFSLKENWILFYQFKFEKIFLILFFFFLLGHKFLNPIEELQ